MVTFPANLLLKREEIETGKNNGPSIIMAIHHNKGYGRKTFLEAPFDLLYGFRGSTYAVDLYSPYEMLRFWMMERVLPPKQDTDSPTSRWTEEGRSYQQRCNKRKKPHISCQAPISKYWMDAIAYLCQSYPRYLHYVTVGFGNDDRDHMCRAPHKT